MLPRKGLVKSARETWPNLFTEQLQRFRTFAWPRMTCTAVQIPRLPERIWFDHQRTLMTTGTKVDPVISTYSD
jgi:hypothetical protein